MAKVTRSTPTTERTMFIGDTHVPFHDPKAIALTLDFAEWLKPSSVYLLGDICDFYRLSRWDKDPKRIETLQDELDQTVHFLDQVRNIVGASCKVYYLEGNHERRLTKFLWQQPGNPIASLRCLELPRLLEFEKLGIHYFEEDADLDLGGFLVEHGHHGKMSSHSGGTAQKLLDSRQYSGISGHIHRLGVHWRTIKRGTFQWLENGCLCDLNPDYMRNANWQQGFTVGYRSKSSIGLRLMQVPILDYKIFFGDTLWKA